MLGRRVALTLLMVFAAVALILAAHDPTSARSQAVTSSGERFTNYVQPTGVEITPQVAAEKAIQHVFNTEGSNSPAALAPIVEVAHSTEAVAVAVLEGQKPAEASTVGSDVEQTELRQSTVYLVVMRGEFSPQAPTPRGTPGPRGSIFSMVIDAHTGWVMTEQLGGESPATAELGPVTMLTVDASSSAAITAERLSPDKGVLVGTVYHGGKPTVGWRVVARSVRHTSTMRTLAHGSFFFRLLPGTYTLSAYRPSGRLCGRRTEQVKRRHYTYATIECK